MKWPRNVVIGVWVISGLLSTASGQVGAPAQPSSAELARVAGYNSLYCAGFITDRVLQKGLYVMSNDEEQVQNEFATGNIVYLSKGAGWIVNPGGDYIVYRPTKDLVKFEAFPGQKRMLKQLGTMYEQVGRIKVNIVHAQSATAHILHACDSISAGDFLIPFNVKAAIPKKPAAGFDRFAPASGKTVGTIVTGKQYARTLGTGDIAYLDIGGNHGVQVGQNCRVFRPFESSARHPNRRYMNKVPDKIMGQRIGLHLSRAEQQRLPRSVLGEMVILHVEPRSATALISFSQKEIFAGDHVELE